MRYKFAFTFIMFVAAQSLGADTTTAPSPPGIDAILHHVGWRDGTFGPTGCRLFTERLDHGLGLRGQFSYIHYAKINDPIQIMILRNGEVLTLTEEAVDWYPSHIAIRYVGDGLTVIERKFITDDDVFVDCFSVTNRLDHPADYEVRMSSMVTSAGGGSGRVAEMLRGQHVFSGVEVESFLVGNGFRTMADAYPLVRTAVIEPGASVDYCVALAIGDLGCQDNANRWVSKPDPLKEHCRRYQQWFDDNCPRFECNDPYVTRCWWYRMFIMRHCLSRARVGNLPHAYFFEGTHESHFPRLIAFSSPHIIDEARWLRNGDYAWGQVLNHTLNPDDQDKFFISARVDKKGGDYNNWITTAAWGLYEVHPNLMYLEECLAPLIADVRGTLKRFDPDGNKLPAPRSHWTTGMEFQPSFFYFTDYDDTKPDAKLERPDFASYLYANAMAVMYACRELGQAKLGTQFETLAQEIRQACIKVMWDEQDNFFYAARQGDGAKARVREVVDFYPFAFGLAPLDPKYTAALKYLIDPAEFWTPFPPATVSKKCPAYTPIPERWPAKGGKTHGCMWNGPAWPHATSVVLNAVAAAIQDYRQDIVNPDYFRLMLDRYTHLHFPGDNLGQPLLREYNNGDTGEPTGCPDYFHSTYCDLIVRYVAGLQPNNDDRLIVRPIPGLFSRFALTGVRYRNHLVDIVYNTAEVGRPTKVGLSVYVDGHLAAHRATLGDLVVDLVGK